MMYGRGDYGNGFNENSSCLGNGFLNHGWNMFIVIGAFLIITLMALKHWIILINRSSTSSF